MLKSSPENSFVRPVLTNERDRRSRSWSTMSMRSYRDARTLLITIPYRRLLYVVTGTGTGPVAVRQNRERHGHHTSVFRETSLLVLCNTNTDYRDKMAYSCSDASASTHEDGLD